jgi:hypothetical protein
MESLDELRLEAEKISTEMRSEENFSQKIMFGGVFEELVELATQKEQNVDMRKVVRAMKDVFDMTVYEMEKEV